MQFQKAIAQERDSSVIEKYYKKKFAREAEWEDMKEKLMKLMEICHVNYKSYAEEYEEFITIKMKQAQSHVNGGSCKSSSHDYYSILGVDRCASEEEIKRNFRVLIMQIHPDFSEYVVGWYNSCIVLRMLKRRQRN